MKLHLLLLTTTLLCSCAPRLSLAPPRYLPSWKTQETGGPEAPIAAPSGSETPPKAEVPPPPPPPQGIIVDRKERPVSAPPPPAEPDAPEGEDEQPEAPYQSSSVDHEVSSPVAVSREPPEGETASSSAPIADAELGSKSTASRAPAAQGRAGVELASGLDPDQLSSYPEEAIADMRSRSTAFRRLHDRVQRCTRDAEEKVGEHAKLQLEIDSIEGKKNGSSKRVQQLRARERKLEQEINRAYQGCMAMESRLAQMLRAKMENGEI